MKLSRDKKRVIDNFLSLGFLQISNYILPLLTIPYLIRVIGIEKFGLITFITAFINYFNIIVDYSFNITATRAISIHKENLNKISKIYSCVFTIKTILLLFCLCILTLLGKIFPKINEYFFIYILTFGNVIGYFLFPTWFFQGVQKMRYITILNLLSKFIFFIAIFIFVKKEADFYLVALFNSLGFIFVGIYAQIIVKKDFKIKFNFQKPNLIWFYFASGFSYFLVNASNFLYKNSNILILGFITNPTLLGYYALCEKVIKIIQSFQDVFGNSIFPYFAKQISKSKETFFNFTKKYFKFIFLTYFLCFLTIFCFTKLILQILGAKTDPNLVLDLRILSFSIIISGINFYFGNLGLILLKHSKQFTKFIVFTTISNIFMCSILSYFFADIGASISYVISEILLCIQIIHFLRSNNASKLYHSNF